jgi:hypothetical protein
MERPGRSRCAVGSPRRGHRLPVNDDVSRRMVEGYALPHERRSSPRVEMDGQANGGGSALRSRAYGGPGPFRWGVLHQLARDGEVARIDDRSLPAEAKLVRIGKQLLAAASYDPI